jgi:hypothetical protein
MLSGRDARPGGGLSPTAVKGMTKKISDPQERQYTKALEHDVKKSPVFFMAVFARNRLMAAVLVLLLLSMAFGGYFGWRYYQYRQSGNFAFGGFISALQPPNAESLAKFIDFNTLSDNLARVIARNYVFLKQGPNQVRDLRDMIQMQLLRRVMTKEEPAREKQDPQKLLQMPLVALPDDFLTQFTKNLVFQASPSGQKEGPVILSSSVEHPMLQQTFPVLLRMENRGDGWIIRDIANADELVGQFRQAQLKRMTARRDDLLAKRTATTRRMNGIIALQSCSAGLETLSDGKTLLLVASILGRNITSLTVNSTNIEVAFRAADGEEPLLRRLNVAQPVRPGEDYNQHWTLELDPESPSGQHFLKAGEIACVANWYSMALSNGEVLHLSEMPELVEDFR